MQTFRLFVVAACAAALLIACQKGDKDKDKDKDKDSDKAGAAATTATGQKPANPANPHGAANQEPPPMDVAAPPPQAKKTESGVHYVVLTEGKGDKKPGRNDTAQVSYTVWKTSGQTLFSTKRRGQPQPMPLPMIPQGWSEMLLDMKIGEKRLAWMPANLATRGGNAQPGETFVFEMELASYEEAPPVPADVAAPPADAAKTKSGLAYKILEPGTGKEKARPWDQVTVNYTGWSSDGLMFESTYTRNRPRPMSAYQESAGWSEAIQQMAVGQKTRVWMPANLAPKRPGMPEGTLVYDIELTEIKKMTDPPPVPKDVAAAPKDAKKTEKGVFYKVLKKGKGKEHPTADSKVKVHYTGWTTDGNMFDSSIIRGQPAEFQLRGVIPGWTEGLQVMVPGETTRFWIPEELAYKGQAGRPQGMLVFDVELIEIMAAPPPAPVAPPQVPAHGQLKGQEKLQEKPQQGLQETPQEKPGAAAGTDTDPQDR